MAGQVKYRVRLKSDGYYAAIIQDGKWLDSVGPFFDIEDAKAALDEAEHPKGLLKFPDGMLANAPAAPKPKVGGKKRA